MAVPDVELDVSGADTYWTESLDPARHPGPGRARSAGSSTSRPGSPGPVFNRIFDTPNNGYAQKFKHVIEPTFSSSESPRSTSSTRSSRSTARTRSSAARRADLRTEQPALRQEADRRGKSSACGITQSYYSNSTRVAVRSELPEQLQRGGAPNNFSPVRIQSRVRSDRPVPDSISRTDTTPTVHTFTTYTMSGSLQRQPLPGDRRLERAALHSRASRIRQPGARQPRHQRLDDGPQPGQPPGRHLLVQLRPAATTTSGSSDHGLLQLAVLRHQHRVPDLQFRRQSRSFVVPQDHRFNLSFTLAGIGTFSNFFGAFGGQQGR